MQRLRGSAGSMINEGKPVGYLLAGNAAFAVDALKAAQSRPHDAETANDLAAALLVRAAELGDSSLAADALAATDDALEINPRSAPALFNRGLALARLGLRSEARRAWIHYLDIDPNSEWSDEAARRLSSLSVSSQAEEWDVGSQEAQRLPPAAAVEEISRLTRKYPQQARLWAEGLVMNQWSVASLKGDASAAAVWLSFARCVGSILRETSGESLVHDAVAAVDRADTHDKAAHFARAYIVYSEGRAIHHANHPVEAEAKFRQAASMFEAAGSPMQYVARYYLGSALHAQLKLVEAAAVLDPLAAEHIDMRGYRAIDATFGWERGACLMERGAISASIDVFSRSRDVFLQLNEIDLAAVMDAYLASAFDYLGDEVAAWKMRCRAFDALSRSGNRYRLLVIEESAAAAAIRAGQWDRAAALLNITTAEAERLKKPIVGSEAYTYFARVDVERGDMQAAATHINAARQWTAQLEDPSVRARAEAMITFVDGLTLRRRNPGAALARLTDALRFFERADRRVEVPRIYLERAALKESSRDIPGARSDLDAGIEAVEFERRQVHDLAQRATLLVAFDALFEKALDLAMRAGDYEAAFGLAERHRARALSDMFELNTDPSAADGMPLSLSAIRAMLAPDAAVVEYSVLPDRLVTFVVRRASFSAVTTPVSRDQLGAALKLFCDRSERGKGDVIGAASSADRLLIQPVRYALEGATHVAVVPDPYVARVPFAALYDSVSERFLIENSAITITPSATLALNASKRARPSAKDSSILAIAGDVFDSQRYPSAAPLEAARGEAGAVAASYAAARVLAGEEATSAAVIKALPQYDFIHFATHGVTAIPVADSALLLAPSHNDGGLLRARDIAALTLRRARVVVLAACGSANPVPLSDGVSNLSLAFLAAGVPVTVASLADVDDRISARMMEALHRRVAAGADASDAVRAIIVGDLRDSRNKVRLPLQWSTVVVIGGSGDLLSRERKGRS